MCVDFIRWIILIVLVYDSTFCIKPFVGPEQKVILNEEMEVLEKNDT